MISLFNFHGHKSGNICMLTWIPIQQILISYFTGYSLKIP